MLIAAEYNFIVSILPVPFTMPAQYQLRLLQFPQRIKRTITFNFDCNIYSVNLSLHSLYIVAEDRKAETVACLFNNDSIILYSRCKSCAYDDLGRIAVPVAILQKQAN